ncbi:MAG: cobalamin B12-binding domain-containing protein [Armatimonadota bacterium]|nr:MAG: cobalamin B12-binding domain-containing protein [Armatimonadota bacterium]
MSKIIGAAIGNCVHVAGVLSFLNLARRLGHDTEFLGAAVSVDDLIRAIRERDPDIVAASYRLTPEVARELFADLARRVRDEGLERKRYVVGGTPPVCEVANETGLFEAAFSGAEGPEEVIAYLRGEHLARTPEDYGTTLLERLERKAPYPLLRHHYGRPTVEETVRGARQIAEARVLDVLSIGPDQNAQEHFFRPEEMKDELSGAGGVPLRSPDDLRAIYEATRTGNYPLLRIYSGTRDLVKWAEVATDTIHNAWAAIPLCWYNTLDRRADRPPEQSIAENQQAIRWYAERGIPVELNEPHHWSLREAHDALSVAMAYVAAYNAKALGVRHYVSQYMFNTPATMYAAMDLAKMLAQAEAVESLHDDGFASIRQTRAGLLHFSTDPDIAKGQLASSTVVQLALDPRIIHVVGFCEGDHAVTAEELIESCRIADGVLRNCLAGMANLKADPAVHARKQHLLRQAEVTVAAIRALGDGETDALIGPATLARAIRDGIFDAPHLCGNPDAAGRLATQAIDGAIEPIDLDTGKPITEEQRVERVLGRVPEMQDRLSY